MDRLNGRRREEYIYIYIYIGDGREVSARTELDLPREATSRSDSSQISHLFVGYED
jgi:hypothetical protein